MDRETVIKGLECCSKNHCAGEECPYYRTDCDSIRTDALALLKEQQERIETLESLRRIEQEGR